MSISARHPLSVVLMRSPLVQPWMAITGIVLAVGIALGMLEPAGWEPAGAINAIAYLIWSVWLVALGVMLIIAKPEAKAAKLVAAAQPS